MNITCPCCGDVIKHACRKPRTKKEKTLVEMGLSLAQVKKLLAYGFSDMLNQKYAQFIAFSRLGVDTAIRDAKVFGVKSPTGFSVVMADTAHRAWAQDQHAHGGVAYTQVKISQLEEVDDQIPRTRKREAADDNATPKRPATKARKSKASGKPRGSKKVGKRAGVRRKGRR